MKINFVNVANQKNTAKKSSKPSLDSNTSVEICLISSDNFAKSNNQVFKNAKKDFDFSAKFLQTQLVIKDNSSLILVGLGDEKKLTDLALNKIGGKILQAINGYKFSNAKISFEDSKLSAKSSEITPKIAFGMLLQSYRFNKYFVDKLKGKELKVQEINFEVSDEKKAKASFQTLELLAKNIFMVRDLVSEPSNILNPESYADFCKTLKKDQLEIEVLGKEQMKKLGMNALLGVGQGSDKESKLVVFNYRGGKKDQAPLAFVGKGVTFDTGGISIKPSANMEDMKTDMSGSAVVVGLLHHLAQRKAKVNVVGVIGLVENMPSGTAQRPGDVVKSMSGQTIEVINTDAEGRLVLADALHYTITKYKPQLVVDLATLTGAIIVSLADVYAGLFCNDDQLAKDLINSSQQTGDLLWRMPIGEEYDEMINSDIADMKNVGSGRGAGSITAAQFLKRFVGQTKWAHLDIAGVAWKGKGDAMAHKGATGFGLRLLDNFVQKFEK